MQHLAENSSSLTAPRFASALLMWQPCSDTGISFLLSLIILQTQKKWAKSEADNFLRPTRYTPSYEIGYVGNTLLRLVCKMT